MILSRAILALILIVIGGMVSGVHKDVEKLSGEVAAVATKIDAISFIADLHLQRVTGWIGKPRVAPVRHIYRKAPTVIDAICQRQ